MCRHNEIYYRICNINQLSTFFLRLAKEPSYLTRFAIKRAPSDLDNFNEMRIFASLYDALSKERGKERKQRLKLHFAPQICCFFFPSFSASLTVLPFFFFFFISSSIHINHSGEKERERKRQSDQRREESFLALAFSFCSHARRLATATLMGFPSLKRISRLWGKPIRIAVINFDKVDLNYRIGETCFSSFLPRAIRIFFLSFFLRKERNFLFLDAIFVSPDACNDGYFKFLLCSIILQ